MKNVLVTGGLGFIGFNALVDWPKKMKNCTFVCFDSETYAAQFKLEEKKKILADSRVVCIKKSICDPIAVERVISDFNIDTIVNFAAESHVDNSISGPMPFFETNVIGVVNLLEACKKHGCRLHQVSTDEVIGAKAPEDEDDTSEEAKLEPSSPYSSSKAAAELIVQSYVKTFGIDATISRCTNNIGEWQNPEKLVPKTILNALAGEKIPVYGDGKQRRFWIDVKSHNDALLKILKKGKTGEIYNIAPPEENLLKNIDLVKQILNAVDKDETLIEHVKDRAAHDVCYWLDSDKTFNELGWADNRDFKKTLKRTIEWYKKECSNED